MLNRFYTIYIILIFYFILFLSHFSFLLKKKNYICCVEFFLFENFLYSSYDWRIPSAFLQQVVAAAMTPTPRASRELHSRGSKDAAEQHLLENSWNSLKPPSTEPNIPTFILEKNWLKSTHHYIPLNFLIPKYINQTNFNLWIRHLFISWLKNYEIIQEFNLMMMMMIIIIIRLWLFFILQNEIDRSTSASMV